MYMHMYCLPAVARMCVCVMRKCARRAWAQVCPLLGGLKRGDSQFPRHGVPCHRNAWRVRSRPSSRAAKAAVRPASRAKVARSLAAVSKSCLRNRPPAQYQKTPEWFRISGVPVRPLTAREVRRAPNKARLASQRHKCKCKGEDGRNEPIQSHY